MRTHGDRADAQARQQRYGAVLAAADAEATAFVNLRYDRAAEGDRGRGGGCDRRLPRPLRRSARVIAAILQQQQSAMTGRVVWSGVTDVGPDRATVIVATTGTVVEPPHRRPGGAATSASASACVHEGGRWLTSDIEFVGDAR